MDQVKIGKRIAELRRKEGLTQEALGEKLGVSNKTISRWENGNYMPDIEMLPLLAREFKVSIDELLGGEGKTAECVGSNGNTEKSAIVPPQEDPFSLEERKAYFQKKWRKEHISLFAVLFLIFAASIAFPLLGNKPYLLGAAPLVALIEYGYQHNRMMTYVESSLFDRLDR